MPVAMVMVSGNETLTGQTGSVVAKHKHTTETNNYLLMQVPSVL